MPENNLRDDLSGRPESTTRNPTELISKLDRRLLAYAAAAGAAGVSLLALAQPSLAEVVYTPTHQPQHDGKMLIDLNNDGITDFTINEDPAGERRLKRQESSLASSRTVFSEFLSAPKLNRVAINSLGEVSAIPAGQQIDQGIPFRVVGARVFMYGCFVHEGISSTFSGCTGSWWNTSDRYLGLAFSIRGEMHFGWARLKTTGSVYSHDVFMTGYAYETVPGRPIRAGQTTGDDASDNDPGAQSGTLGSLAAGAQSRSH